jgi:hypothetical protein
MNEAQFIRSGAPHAVEVAQGSHDAKSKSATLGADAKRIETDTAEFVRTAPPTELKTLSFDHSSTMPGSSPQVLNADKASLPPPRITSAPPVIRAAAALDVHTRKPAPETRQGQSHFSDQIGTLKAQNNHIRAELKRRESVLIAKT